MKIWTKKENTWFAYSLLVKEDPFSFTDISSWEDYYIIFLEERMQ